MKKYLIILQQAPFANAQSLEALELSLALAAFAQPVSLLFMGDGVLQLLANQAPELIAHKAFTKTFAGLNLFDINNVYIEQATLNKYALNNAALTISPEPLTTPQIAALISKHDIILTV